MSFSFITINKILIFYYYYLKTYIYIYIYRVRFTWDQAVSVRPVRPIFFIWNFTPKHCEGKKNSNIHSKNTVKVTFTEFFDVKVRFFVTFIAFSLWSFGLCICYLHNSFTVNVSFFTSFWVFFTSKVFFTDGYSNFIYLHGVL